MAAGAFSMRGSLTLAVFAHSHKTSGVLRSTPSPVRFTQMRGALLLVARIGIFYTVSSQNRAIWRTTVFQMPLIATLLLGYASDEWKLAWFRNSLQKRLASPFSNVRNMNGRSIVSLPAYFMSLR